MAESDHKLTTPSSSTGIIRFYDIKSSNVQIEPQLVIAGAIAFIVLILLFQVVRF
ncbi:preprotein translocase subunit Sec61beta [Candidatus Micrarchaeota archaeon]|nr:preprotein translocase subunit Sec61beta [Candidatus Micrarchaeota archaeon]